MKIKLSKAQWEMVGEKAGWISKKAQWAVPMSQTGPYANMAQVHQQYQNQNNPSAQQPQTNAFGQQVVQQGNIGPGSKYNAIVQQMPQIKQMVDWLNVALKNTGKLDPKQEQQVRSTQSNLINAFKQMKLDPMQYPEVAQVVV